MAFATIHYRSRSLRKASSFNIIFPEEPAAPRPWAAFYLLHGLSDDPGVVFNLSLNNSRPLLRDAAVRQALDLAIDRSG